jgi:hypothetical protein
MRPIYHHDPRAAPGPYLCCRFGLFARTIFGEKAEVSQAPLFQPRSLDLTSELSTDARGGRRGHQTPRGHCRKMNRRVRSFPPLNISSLEPWKPKKRTRKTPTSGHFKKKPIDNPRLTKISPNMGYGTGRKLSKMHATFSRPWGKANPETVPSNSTAGCVGGGGRCKSSRSFR